MKDVVSILKCVQCGYEHKKSFAIDDYEGKIFFLSCPKCKGDLILETVVGLAKPKPQVVGRDYKELEECINAYFQIKETTLYGEAIVFEVVGPDDASPFYDKVVANTLEYGYVPLLRKEKKIEEKERKVIICVKKSWTEEAPKKRTIYGLLLATILTTFITGLGFSWGFYDSFFLRILGALSFSGALLLIVGTHELGHKRAAKLNNVFATNPYFIPAPPFISIFGTFGAIIKVRSPIPNRNAAIELGASGPILSFALSIPVLIIGLLLSKVVSESSFDGGGISFQVPLIMRVIMYIFSPHVGSGEALLIHPMALAGWIGLFVTAINLFPAGQLDAGHVSRAALGEKGHMILAQIVIISLIIMGVFLWPTWIIWAFLLHFLTRSGHPGSLDEVSPIKKKNKLIAVFLIVIFFLCFTPIPVKFVD